MLIPDIFSKIPSARPKRGVLHVGAHVCEEFPLYISLGLNPLDILWIDANADLKPTDMDNYWIATVSDVDNTPVTFHITDNMQSSSVLPLKDHLYEHPSVREIAQRTLYTVTLNTLFKQRATPYDRYDVINLDIQGAELMALRGATELLPHVRAIYTEVNIKELYAGCALLPDMDAFLASYGFSRVSTLITQHGWGDALYIRIELI
jgi:FkbM family methyltransferase